MLRNLEYHINFGYTFVTETWPLHVSRMGYLKVTTWHVFRLLASFTLIWITIISILNIFCGTGLALTHTGYTTYQYHKVSVVIFQLPLCSMNMDTKMVLLSFWWRAFNEEIAAIPTASILHPPIYMQQYFDQHLSRWLSLCHKVKIWYSSNYRASNILVIIRK